MLPIEIWGFILSYLPLIDLLNISACSKMFYRLASDDETFKIKFKDSHSLVLCAGLFDRYHGKCVIISWASKIFWSGLNVCCKKKNNE